MTEQEFEAQRQEWLRDRARLETRVIEQRRQIESLQALLEGKLSRAEKAAPDPIKWEDAAVGQWVSDGFGRVYQIQSFGPLGFTCKKGSTHHWGHYCLQFCDPPVENP